MDNIWRRSLSFLLAMVMILGMVPVNTFAVGTDETSLPEETITESSEDVTEETPTEEAPTPSEPNLSGETRTLYFCNTEQWDEVWAVWSVEDYQAEAEEMTQEEAVWTVEVPVEAESIVFSDGNSYTEEELDAYWEETGEDLVYEIAEDIPDDADYFDGQQWLSYEEYLAELEALAEVQAMIDALPTEFASQDEVDTFWDVTAVELDAAIEALTAEQQEQLDTANYDAAIDAAAAFVNPEFEDATTWEVSVSEGETATVEKKDATSVSVDELKNDTLATPNRYIDAGVRYRVKDSEADWTTAVTGNVTLEHNATYEVQEIYTRIYTTQYSSSYYITFKVYHEPTITTTVPEGYTVADATLDETRYYHGDTATVTVTYVEGLNVSASFGGTPITLTKGENTYTGTFPVNSSDKVKVEYKLPTDSTFVPGTVADDVSVTVNETDLTASGVSVEANTNTTVDATYTGSDKNTYVDSVTVKSGDTTVVSGVSSAILTTAETATNYTVDVTTANAIVLSSTTISYNPNDEYTVWENAIKALVTSVAGKTPSTLTVTYQYEYFGTKWGALNASNDGTMGVGAYSFGDTESETVRITDGTYTWEGTITLTEARTEVTLSPVDPITVEVNGYNEARMNLDFAGLKSDILTEAGLIGEDSAYTADDFIVELQASSFYYNLDELGTVEEGIIYTAMEVPETGRTAKITLDSASSVSETVTITVNIAESRTAATIDVTNPINMAVDSITDADVVAEVQKNVTVKDNKGNTVTDATVAVQPTTGYQAGENSVTVTVTNDGSTYLENTTGESTVVKITVNEYTVTWNPNGGNWEGVTENHVDTYHKDDTIIAPADPAKTGYTFNGWGVETLPTTMGTENLTFTAQWTPNTDTAYKVEIYEMDTNGVYGEPTTENKTGTTDTTATYEPEAKTGFTVDSEESVLYGKIAGDGSLVLKVYYKRNQYTITWNAGDGNFTNGKTMETTVYHGVTPTAPETPTKAADGQNTYKFQTWGNVVAATEPATYTANYVVDGAVEYTVTWYDEDGTTPLHTAQVPYGGTPVYEGETPTKAATAEHTYTFDGWDAKAGLDENGKVTGDAKLVAKYAATKNKYTVTFYDEDGTTVLQSGEVEYDTVPTAPAAPTKTGDAQYSYTFAGWTPEVVAVTGNATYKATYTQSVNQYTITFVDENGTKLNEQTLNYGATPEYKGEALSKQYYHVTWTPEITTVTENAEYKLVWTINNDTNENNVPDELETITVSFSNATVKVDGTEVVDGVATVYDSTKGATVTVTPTKGYYVDVTLDGTLTGTYENKWQSGVINADYRNVCTVTVEANSGNHTIAATGTKYELTLPKTEVSISTSGYNFNFANLNLTVDMVLDAIYAGEEVEKPEGSYTGSLPFELGSLSVKLEEPFDYVITKAATDKYPAVSATVKVTVTDNRQDAVITHTYETGTFNTEDDFKKAFAGTVTFNGQDAGLDELTALLSGSITWTYDETAKTYTATVTANNAEGWLETTKTFEGLTWTVNQYTVTFLDKDDNELSSKQYDYGTAADQIEKPDAPAVEGYTFNGWTVNKVTEDVTYKATYTVNSYTVTFMNGETEVISSTLAYGTPITVPANLTKEGHTFAGWDANGDKVADTVAATMGAADVTYTALWTVNKYSVTWNYKAVENGEVVDKTETQSLDYGSVISAYTVPATYEDGDTTYTFKGWDGFIANTTVPVNGATYTAIYTPATVYTVTFVTNGGTDVDTQYITVENNETVTEPAKPTKDDHRFAGWYSDEACTQVYTFGTTPEGNITLYAKWVEQVTVTFDSNGGTAVESKTFDINGTATEPDAPTKDQAIFAGWYLGETKFNFATEVTKDIILTAKWLADVNNNEVVDTDETITVTIVGNGTVNGNTETYTVVYDSVKDTTISINAVPVIENGTSKSFISSITAGEEELELTYTDYCVKLDAPAADVVVTFTDCGFTYDEDGQMRFYVGMETPEYDTLYNAVITSPAYDKDAVESVKYLARPAATYQLEIPVLFSYDLPDWINAFGVDDIKIGGNTQNITLDDAWLDVGQSFKTLTPEELQKQYDTEIQKIKDEIAAIDLSNILTDYRNIAAQFAAIGEELNTLITTITNEAQHLGYHQFGASTLVDENGNVQEILQVIYANDAMRLVDEEVIVTLVDDRIETTITGGDLTFEYDEFTDETIMNALVLTDVDGNVVKGELTKVVDLVGSNVGTYTYSVSYAGSWDYKPCTAEFTLTVIKAPSNMDVPNVNVTYGEEYDGAPVITNKHDKVINIDSFRFLLGLDVSKLDIDGDGVHGLSGEVQLIVPEDVQNILTAIGLEDGVTVSLNQLVEMLNNGGTLLEQWGLTQEMIDAINQALGAINNVVEAGDMQITIGGSYPTDIGAYLQLAVSSSGNYETSYDVGYIIIQPAVTQVHLKWNHEDENGIFTRELLQHIDFGASAYNDEAFTTKNEDATALIQNVIFGLDAEGNVVAELNATDNLTNGAYSQIAMIADFGNTMYAATPIVRAFVITPNTVDVEIVDEGTRTFNNQPQNVDVNVTYEGTVTDITESENLTVTYTGVQTNGKIYESSTTAPTHAGVYVVTAIYQDIDEDGNVIAFGLDVQTLTVLPAESSIDVTGGPVTYDGEEHTATVEITEGYTYADYTLISGGATVSGDIDEVGLDALHGNVNIDFPKWLDEALAEYEFKTEGVDTVYLIDFIGSYRDDLMALIPVEELIELGVAEEKINAVVDQLNGYIDELLEVLDQLPEDVALTFNDDVTYTEPGYYAYYGIVTDSDHMPSTDTGLLVIEKMDMVFDLVDTTVPYSGEEEFVDVTMEPETDYIYATINRDTNVATLVLDSDAQALYDLLKDIMVENGVMADDDVYDVANVLGAIEEVLDAASAVELPEEIAPYANEVLAKLYDILYSLPQNGTVIVNGDDPVAAGTYEIYALTYSEYYKTVVDDAILTIAPIHIVVDDQEAGKVYGADEPELTASVSCYYMNGEEKVPVEQLPEDVGLTYTVVRENGENVGIYDMTVTASMTDTSGNYVLDEIVQDGDDFEITPAAITIKIKDATKVYGVDDPDFTYEITAGELVEGDELNVVYTREEGEDVGEYAITATATNGNYEITVVNEAKLTITKATVDITVDNKTKVYGEADPEFTYTVTGLVEGDDLGIKISRVEGEDVGDYAITATATNGNYEINVVSEAKLTIEPKQITEGDVTLGETLTYNGAEQTQGITVTEGITYDVTNNTGKDADNYTLTVTGTGNYTGSVDVDWTIAQKAATITVDNLTIVEGNEYELTATVDGVVDGEQLNYTLSTDYDPEISEAGEYDITVTLGENPNYIVTVTSGTLKVEVNDYVCWNMQTGVYYNDLSVALDDVDGYDENGVLIEDELSVETIQMLKDWDEQYVIIAPGTTLDLAGHTVTADFVVGLNGSYLTGDINSGKLYVPTTNIALSEACYNDPKTGYDVLPIYVGDHYTFSYFLINIEGEERGLKMKEDKLYFQFVADASTWAFGELSNGMSDNKLSVIVRLTWKNKSETGYAHQDFIYLDEHISKTYTGKRDLFLSLDGFDALDMDIDTLEVKAMVVSNSGVLSDCDPQILQKTKE